jgi:hypothetical protein
MKDFKQDFEIFWKRIFVEKQSTFFARYADGEAGLMIGKTFNEFNQIDGWNSNGYNQFNIDLSQAIKNNHPDYFYAISCHCCDVTSKNFLLSEIVCPIENVTFANLWINGNYFSFKNRLSEIKEEVILIGNQEGVGRVFPFNISKYLPISKQAVEDWNKDKDSFINNFLESVLGKENPLVLFAAGPISEVLINLSFQKGIKGRFVDIGSSLDEYIFQRKTRPYMMENTPYINKVCQF